MRPLRIPPSLIGHAPTAGAQISAADQFSWTSFASGVHVLELEADAPTTAAPSINIYTAETSAMWPDLSAANIVFPHGATYHVSVLGAAPYGSMDEALGPQGIGATVPVERRMSRSAAVSVATSP